jgi:hypothetical protein
MEVFRRTDVGRDFEKFVNQQLKIKNTNFMFIEKLFEKEVTIKVSIVKIDKKKLTKGVFNQLNVKSPFDDTYNFRRKYQVSRLRE